MMLSDVVLEVLRAAVLLGLVAYLWRHGRRFNRRAGWNLILAGFGLILGGTLLDVTDNFESLNRFVVIGDTEAEAFLEKVIGYLGGFIVLAIGLARWAPTVERLDAEVRRRERAEADLRALNARLEGRVAERTRELSEHAKALEASNTELQQFAYVASHDLREPLRMVVSYLQLLQIKYAGALEPPAPDYIRFAVDGASRMDALIRDLLQYAQINSRAAEFAPVDALVAVEEAIDNLKPAITEASAVVLVDDLPVVTGDRLQIMRLFQNLIGNALKYRAASRVPEIRVSAEASADVAVFAVRDNGIGIEPQYFERIFIIFQRLHGREEYSGTGIGLAVCRKIVERHGGRIWVMSEPGVGSTFLFTLPLAGDRLEIPPQPVAADPAARSVGMGKHQPSVNP